MAALRYPLPLLIGIFILTHAAASGLNGANPDVGKARAVSGSSGSELAGGWHFVRTKNPYGGVDAISIMHTADPSQSDLDLAGLMIRCNEGRTEVAIVLLRPFPLRARPQVIFGEPGNEIRLEATIAPPGTAVLIPKDATSLVDGPWRALNNLFIRIDEGESTIRGVIALAGLQSAIKILIASCAAQ
jgi:hypothetical protein